MTDESKDYEDRIVPELRALDAPPPLPADSIWSGVEQGLAAARERERSGPAARRRVQLTVAGALAASLALLATGAAVGYGLSARPVEETARVSEEIDETETPTEAIQGDTVQVAWF